MSFKPIVISFLLRLVSKCMFKYFQHILCCCYKLDEHTSFLPGCLLLSHHLFLFWWLRLTECCHIYFSGLLGQTGCFTLLLFWVWWVLLRYRTLRMHHHHHVMGRGWAFETNAWIRILAPQLTGFLSYSLSLFPATLPWSVITGVSWVFVRIK